MLKLKIPHIVAMENGRIVGEGNHETLTRTCAAYRDILEAERHESPTTIRSRACREDCLPC